MKRSREHDTTRLFPTTHPVVIKRDMWRHAPPEYDEHRRMLATSHLEMWRIWFWTRTLVHYWRPPVLLWAEVIKEELVTSTSHPSPCPPA